MARIVKPQAIGLLTRPFEFRREFWLGVATLSFVPVGDTPALLPETALWPFLAEELPPDQPLDAGIPKIQPEFVAIAHAYAPGGTPAPKVEVGIQLGPVIKRLTVHGDREFGRSGVTDPVPFTTMPITWARAFGGKTFADNPLGKGAAPLAERDDQTFAAPNVCDPQQPDQVRKVPFGFAPIDQMWPVRANLRGTYDDAWRKHDFPGFPRDIDWRFFNVAPSNQWLPGPLAGDETYAFKNLHAAEPLLRGRLPGIAPRLFVVRKGQEDEDFEEIPLSLTTVWCFPHRERLVLVHHGRARIAEEDGSDIARVVLGADPLGALRPSEHYRAVMNQRLDRENGALHTLRDEDLVPAAWLVADPALAVPEAATAARTRMQARRRKRAEKQLDQQREQLKARGLDPDAFTPRELPPDPPAPSLEDLPATIAKARDQAAAEKQKAMAALEAQRSKMATQLAASGMPKAEIERKLNAKPKGPPAFSAAAVRADITRQITGMRVLGVLTAGLEAQLASPEFNAKLAEAEAALRRTYRLTAQHQDPADALPAERCAEIRRLIAGDTAAARACYDLHGADLAGLDLSGLDLSGICLDGANCAGASFAGANLGNAVLAHARLDDCVLNDANLTGANLGKAQLAGASLRRARLKNAVLAGADLSGATLAGADLEGADLGEAILTDTDFAGVRAPGLLAMKLSLRGLRMPGIVLTKAKFIECDLEDADLTGAVLDGTVFIGSKLTGLCCAGANMRKAVFVAQCSLAGADLSGADLTEANLRETALPGAKLDGAIVERADLSAADLTGATLIRVRGAGSRWTAAVLRNAVVRGADFSQADLARADLRGADVSLVSLYEANVPRVKLDRTTIRAGLFTTRMRYLPVAQPAEGSGA